MVQRIASDWFAPSKMVLGERLLQNGDDDEVSQDGERSAVAEKGILLGVGQDVQHEDRCPPLLVARHHSLVHLLLEPS